MEEVPIVIDNGSGMVKAGFAGEESPCCVFPSIIGYPRFKHSMRMGGEKKSVYMGDEAYHKKGILKIKYPIEHGIVDNWDDMELLWKHTFEDQLRVNSEERAVMLTEAPQNPKKNRERMMEIMFEKFNVLASYVSVQGVLSLYASGRTTGIVLDIGDGVTHTIPVFEGYGLSHAIFRHDIAGRDVTEYLQRLLEFSGHRLNSSAEKEIVRNIKEKYIYCAEDPEEEEKIYQTKNMTRKYVLPDGNEIILGDEMFKTTEVLFDPGLIGKEYPGIDEIVNDSILKTDMDIRKDLYSNIVLSGGTTMIRGLDRRLHKTIDRLTADKMKVQIVAPPERKYSVWVGGSILSSLQSFQQAWISRDEYFNHGIQIVHRKCM